MMSAMLCLWHGGVKKYRVTANSHTDQLFHGRLMVNGNQLYQEAAVIPVESFISEAYFHSKRSFECHIRLFAFSFAGCFNSAKKVS